MAQYEQVVKNLKAVVEAGGGTLQDVVKLNIYVTDSAAYRAQLSRSAKSIARILAVTIRRRRCSRSKDCSTPMR